MILYYLKVHIHIYIVFEFIKDFSFGFLNSTVYSTAQVQTTVHDEMFHIK